MSDTEFAELKAREKRLYAQKQELDDFWTIAHCRIKNEIRRRDREKAELEASK